MKHFILSCALSMAAIATSSAQQTGQLPVYLDNTKPVEQRIDDAIARMTLQEKIRIIHAQSKFSSAGVPRLGFPDFWTDDGPHGVRPDVLWDEWEQAGQTNDSCVAFPALTCLAASWNPQMSRIYGEALGEEALYRGKDMILGPGVNIYRTPLNGRNFEYMGEDPYLASIMVVPYIQGLQSKGVSACVKHYCLNNDEEYRHQVNVIVSDRALHEIYLPAFKAAVEKGKTWGIMGAYNLYKNEHNCHNQWTLNKILKGDWKYDGVVVSDWGGAHDTDQAVKNGLDIEFGTWTNGLTMGASNAYDNYYLAVPYIKGIQEGKYTTKELDEKVRRVLRLFYRTTMNPNRPHGFLCSDSHYAAARQIAEEGIVLLQNKNHVLPINTQKAQRVLVVGDSVDLQVWLYVPHALPHNEATAGWLHTDIDKENLNYTLQHWLYASTATSISVRTIYSSLFVTLQEIVYRFDFLKIIFNFLTSFAECRCKYNHFFRQRQNLIIIFYLFPLFYIHFFISHIKP